MTEQSTSLDKYGFELSTELDIVRLLLKNSLFVATYSEYLSPSLFKEQLRPIVDVVSAYWKHYSKLPSNEALVQELYWKIGTNFSKEKAQSVIDALSHLKDDPKDPEYVEEKIQSFIKFQKVQNALASSADILIDAKKSKDAEKLDQINTIINRALEPIIIEHPSWGVADLDKRTERRAAEFNGEFDNIDFFPSGIPPLDRIYGKGGIQKGEIAIVVAPTGRGKCFGINTLVIMYDGTIRMVQDVQVGDLLMGDDSTPRRVLSLARGREMMYRIEQKKGDAYTVNESHILSLKRTKGDKWLPELKVDICVKDYLELSKWQKHILKGYKVAVDFPEKDLPIDPYIIGYWLGDETSLFPEITTAEPEVVEVFDVFAKSINCKLTHRGEYIYGISSSHQCKDDGMQRGNVLEKTLKKLNLIQNKHIPLVYKCNSKANRLKLLAGIIDSDGHSRIECNGIDFVFKSEQLADDIEYLCRSLGFAVKKSPCKKICVNNGATGDYFRLGVYGEGLDEIPTILPRKKLEARKQKKDPLVCGIKVIPVGEDDYYGFEIDGNHRFLLGDFTVTHNTVFLENVSKTNMCLGKKSFYVSLEVSEMLLGDRLDSMVSEVEIRDIVNERNEVRQRFLDLMQGSEHNWGEIMFKEMSGISTSVSTIRNEMYRAKRLYGFEPELLVVDYLDLMIPAARGRDQDWKNQAIVTKELRDLGKEMGCAVWTASQANRIGRNKQEEGVMITDGDAAESYAKTSVADLIVSLNQKKAFFELPDGVPKPMILHVPKNRNGKANVNIGILTDFKKMAFYVGDYDEHEEMEKKALESGAFSEKKGKKSYG